MLAWRTSKVQLFLLEAQVLCNIWPIAECRQLAVTFVWTCSILWWKSYRCTKWKKAQPKAHFSLIHISLSFHALQLSYIFYTLSLKLAKRVEISTLRNLAISTFPQRNEVWGRPRFTATSRCYSSSYGYSRRGINRLSSRLASPRPRPAPLRFSIRLLYGLNTLSVVGIFPAAAGSSLRSQSSSAWSPTGFAATCLEQAQHSRVALAVYSPAIDLRFFLVLLSGIGRRRNCHLLNADLVDVVADCHA